MQDWATYKEGIQGKMDTLIAEYIKDRTGDVADPATILYIFGK